MADGGEHAFDVGAVGFCPAEAEAEEDLRGVGVVGGDDAAADILVGEHAGEQGCFPSISVPLEKCFTLAAQLKTVLIFFPIFTHFVSFCFQS